MTGLAVVPPQGRGGLHDGPSRAYGARLRRGPCCDEPDSVWRACGLARSHTTTTGWTPADRGRTTRHGRGARPLAV